MEKKRMVQNLTIIVLGIAIVVMAVGYASFSSSLNINGTAEVKAAKWDIHFANLTDDTSGLTSPSTGSATLTSATKITFTTALEVNNTYAFTADIVNGGTFDAKIDSITLTGTKATYDADTSAYGTASTLTLTYSGTDGVVYSNDYLTVTAKYDDTISTSGFQTGDQLLKSGATATTTAASTRKIKVTVAYKQQETDTTGEKLPTANEKYTFDLTLGYVQA